MRTPFRRLPRLAAALFCFAALLSAAGPGKAQDAAAPTLAEKTIKDLGVGAVPPGAAHLDIRTDPTGQHVYYVEKRGRRTTVWFDGEERVYDDASSYPLFSPDGAHAAFVAVLDGKQFVVLDGKEGKRYDEVMNLPQQGTSDYVSFSADGSRHAYPAREGRKWYAVCDGVEGPACDVVRHVLLSPDGRRLAYEAQRDGKWFVVLDGAEGPAYDYVGIYHFSPDSRRLCYVVKREGKHLAVCDGKEGPAYDYVGEFKFSPDSRRFGYSARQGNDQFIVMDGKEGPHYVGVGGLQFSPDGGHFGYWAFRGKEQRLIVFDGVEIPGSAYGFAFSPDGRLAHVLKKDDEWYVSYDGRLSACGSVGDRFGTFIPPVFSSDGKHMAHLAYHKETGIQMVRDGVAGRPLRYISFPPVWSPDGQHLAYGGDLRTGGHKLICDDLEGPRGSGGPRFSPDSRHLAYVARAAEGEGSCVVCDGLRGPEHYRAWCLKPTPDGLRYLVGDQVTEAGRTVEKFRLVEIAWPKDGKWSDGLEAPRK